MLHKQIKSPVKWLVLMVVSILFLLVYSSATSPLTDYYGADSSFFVLVGKGMTEGKLPYRDYFDMKGPYFFLIEYIGQLICSGRTGAFIMQCVNLLVCLVIIDRIYHGKEKMLTFGSWLKDGLCFILPCLIIAGYTLERGNLTEEFSLPLLLLALYFAVGYLKQSQTADDMIHPLGQGFYYGLAFGVLALIRVTNAAFIGAILVTIAADLILRGKIKNLLMNGLMFILGCAAAFAPACLYFATQGQLGQMLSQVFVFGVQYSAGVSMAVKFTALITRYWRILIVMTFPMAVLALFRVKDWKYWVLSVSSYLLLVFAATLGNAYIHYFTLGIPHLVLGFVFLIGQLKTVKAADAKLPKWKLVVLAVLLLAVSRNVLSSTLNCVKLIFAPSEESRQIQQIVDAIPEPDRDDVYVFDLESCSNWYLQAGIQPCNKYCDWQANYINLNPEIGAELAQWISDGGPKWIVVESDRSIKPDTVAGAVEANYSVYLQNDHYTLYGYAD